MEKVSENEYVFINSDRSVNFLKVVMSDGSINTFKHYDANFIDSMRCQSTELRIKAMALDPSEMEAFILERRISLATEFKILLSSKKYRDKEEGQIIVWKDWLKDCYEYINLDQPITPYQLVKKVQTGVFSLSFSEEIIETLTSLTTK
jgi:hypothetical protein